MLAVFVLACSFAWAAAPASSAPAATEWTAPELVWQSEGRVEYPVLVTDAHGQSHLFFADRADSAAAYSLYHVSVDESGLGEARDVLVGPSAGVRVEPDAWGRLHVLYHGSNNTLWYASVDGRRAADPHAWSAPMQIGGATLGVALCASGGHDLHACYPRNEAVYHLASVDGGASWGTEQTVASVSTGSIAATVACAAPADGSIHVAWSEVAPPHYYPSSGVFYTWSSGSGLDWLPPEQIAGQHYSLPRMAVDARGDILMGWQGDVAVGGRYYRRLAAGAAGVWSAVETILPPGEGGLSGEMPFAVDSAGNVHAAVTADAGIRHVVRSGSAWAQVADLSASLVGLPSSSGSIEQPALTLADGNRLIAAWEFDFSRIYLARALAAAPRTSPEPPHDGAPASSVASRRRTASPAWPTATSTPYVSPEAGGYERRLAGGGSSSSLPAIVGAVGAAAVIAAYLTVNSRRRPRRGTRGRQ